MAAKTKHQKSFVNSAVKNIGGYLETFGFMLVNKDIDEPFSKIVWNKKDLYVILKATAHPLDYPNVTNICLENITKSEIENYENKLVPLWVMAKVQKVDSKAGERYFPFNGEYDKHTELLKEDIEMLAESFLTDNLEMYNKGIKYMHDLYTEQLKKDNALKKGVVVTLKDLAKIGKRK